MRVLIIGAGGHAHVVADAIDAMAGVGYAVSVTGCLDDDPALHGSRVLGHEVLGPLESRTSIAHDACILAIGDNARRRQLFELLRAAGEDFATVVHPGAVIGSGVDLAPGVFVAATAVLNPCVRVGANAVINTGAIVEHHCIVRDHAHVAPGVRLGGAAVIGEGSLVGIGATVMPRRSVGSWSVVGAGSVVCRDLPAGIIATGVPARQRV